MLSQPCYKNKRKEFVYIFVLDRKWGTAYAWGTDEKQAGEIRVRKLQAGGEHAGRKSSERPALLYFFSVPSWRYFFLGEK